jgi:uncharacterized protein
LNDPARIPLGLFVKRPQPGRVKTRLQPRLDPHQCAALARVLAQLSAVRIRRGWPGPVRLCCWPDLEDPFLARLARRLSLDPVIQAPGDLGAKMSAELAAGIQVAGAAAVIGADTPQVPPAALARAAQALAEGHNLLGEASDGGFWFLGLTRLPEGLLSGFDWGTDSVTERLRARARERGLEFTGDLPRLRDLDTFADLRALARTCPPLERFATLRNAAGQPVP